MCIWFLESFEACGEEWFRDTVEPSQQDLHNLEPIEDVHFRLNKPDCR